MMAGARQVPATDGSYYARERGMLNRSRLVGGDEWLRLHSVPS